MYADEIESFRFEISILRQLIDDALDHGPPNSLLVRASAHVLRARCARLEELEHRSGHHR